MIRQFSTIKTALLLLLPAIFLSWTTTSSAKSITTGAKPPVDFDCGMRALAVEFAFYLQPFRSKATFQEMVDSLNMKGGAPGGETQCFNATVPAEAPDEFVPKFDPPKDGQVYYVDALNGDENNDGTVSSPFQTALRAVEAVRDNKRKRHHHASDIDYAIIFREGVHYFNQTIELTAEDGRISFQNYKGEVVWLSGAKLLANNATNNTWTQDPTLPHIWSLDLSDFEDVEDITGLRINRTRAVRARYPNGCSSDKPLPSGYQCMGFANNSSNTVVSPADGFGSNLLTQWLPVPPVSMHQDNWTQYQPFTAPQRKSGKFFKQYQIGIGGTCQGRFTPPAGYWCGTGCAGGAPPPPGCIVNFAQGMKVDRSVLPNYPYQHPERAVVQAWRPGHWASWMFKVDGEASNQSHIIFSKGGFQGARAVTSGEAFFIENAREELDMDNEFYYNPDEKRLQYHYSSDTPPVGPVEAPMLRTLFQLRGNQSHPVNRIQFLGLFLRDTRLTYLDEHTMAAGGDWGLNTRGAIEARGVTKLNINGCTFEELDGNAVFVKGFARDLVIQNNDFHVIGGNMIALLGETEAPGIPPEWGFGWNGTAGNQPRGTIVRNNFAYRPGLFAKQSSFFFQSKSMQTTLQNNIFFHGPRAGINLNDGFGGGNVLERNLLFASVMETGDHGPFNSWDRQPFAHGFTDDGTFDVEKVANDTIRHNFIIGNFYGQEPIDNDDGSAFFETHHNFLVYGQNGQKADYGGHSNYHHQNLYAFLTGRAVVPDAQSEPKAGEQLQFFNNTVIATTSQHYIRARCWGLLQTVLHNNRILTPDGTMDEVCGMTLAERIAGGLDNNTIVEKWPPTDEILALARVLLFTEKDQSISLASSAAHATRTEASRISRLGVYNGQEILHTLIQSRQKAILMVSLCFFLLMLSVRKHRERVK